ncbi:DEAD/DEAH box helicase family protein [Candidatus Thioglobus sp.]|uniref:DEAD/DEAH box helicase family protein n=1 Tax=Candidatus Thioglobus sp. TaxID=2026721 RepID=UPI003D0FE9C9
MSIEKDPKRVFTTVQRQQIWVNSKGKCQRCGCDLQKDKNDERHAHHIVPHTKGGQTKVDNGQALCAPCHKFKHRELGDMQQYSGFRKDYSWQDRAISLFFDSIHTYYRESKEQDVNQAYVVEVSPSGGKTIFSMKLAVEMINKDLIDRVIWIVPRDSIKMGFMDDCKRAGKIVLEKQTKLGKDFLAIESENHISKLGSLRNHHGVVLTYQGLTPSTIGQIELLSTKHRLLFVFDEAHHGADGNDEAMNTWGQNMLDMQQMSHSIVAMTGTPVRADNRKIPFLTYTDVEEVDYMGNTRNAIRVEPSFKFTYREAVQAGVARRILCVNVDPDVTYSKKGSIKEMPLSQIPAGDLKYVKHTPLDKNDGVIDDMLKKALEEVDRMRRNGDTDAACLIVGQRNSIRSSDMLSHISGRLSTLFSIKAISVESADGDKAKKEIKSFKSGKQKFIVSKEMISEGTNIPRIRIVCILRDIGNNTFYEQLVHRATRNDADDRPEEAIIIQLTYPNLVAWGATLEEESRLIWAPEETKENNDNEGNTSVGQILPEIIGIDASLDGSNDGVIISGKDYSDTDPIAKILIDDVASTGINRAQLNVVLKSLTDRNVDIDQAKSVEEKEEDHPTTQQDLQNKMDVITQKIKKIAYRGPSDYQSNIKEAWNRIKRASGVPLQMSNKEITGRHEDPEKAINAMLRSANSFSWKKIDKEQGELLL